MILILKQCARCGQKRRLVETGALRPSIKVGPPAAKKTPPLEYSSYPPIDDKWRRCER